MNKSRIMLLDDEQHVLGAIQRLLRNDNLEINAFTMPAQALQDLKESGYALIVSDYRMPEMDGVRFLEQARALAPDTVRIMLTGYADLPAVIQAINRGSVSRFLTKPWNDDELRLAIRQGVQQFELQAENLRLQKQIERQNEDLRDLNNNLEQKVQQRTEEITRLNNELQTGFTASVQLLAELGEMHSLILGRHNRRVANLAEAIAKELGLGREQRNKVEAAGLLHDIGKIGILPAVLIKNEKLLTQKEQEIYHGHSAKGEAIVRMIPQSAWDAAPTIRRENEQPEQTSKNKTEQTDVGTIPAMIRSHHEQLNGQGYPDRLRGAAIPLGARIIAVADAYDRFLNNRERFAGVTPAEALQHVHELAGIRFDPAVAAALQRALTGATGAGEIEIRASELRPGMQLARDLHTPDGTLLLAKDSLISPARLEHLRKYFNGSPMEELVCVYRRAAAQ